MAPVSRDFQVFTKPIGSVCNLECRYCYYLKKEERGHDAEARRDRIVSPEVATFACWRGIVNGRTFLRT